MRSRSLLLTCVAGSSCISITLSKKRPRSQGVRGEQGRKVGWVTVAILPRHCYLSVLNQTLEPDPPAGSHTFLTWISARKGSGRALIFSGLVRSVQVFRWELRVL